MEKFGERLIQPSEADHRKYIELSKAVFPRTQGVDAANEELRSRIQQQINVAYQDLQRGFRTEFDRLWQEYESLRTQIRPKPEAEPEIPAEPGKHQLKSEKAEEFDAHLGRKIDVKA